MRLISLEIYGFKSFPDKTTLLFDRGVTAVVGPNGSGKSNISDAVQWVFGELSPKNIRGNKMEDMIFGGSDTRRALSYAEVSITIDNTDPADKINSDYTEITITRCYYRSGESEYMINRKPVRLRDISELFLNTGIGKNGYSIIGQGKIAEVLSQRGDERRIIFEEAAGISKFRIRKAETEKKLIVLNDNLVRIKDIMGELEARLPILEAEAEKAKKYLELYLRKKQTDISIWIYDINEKKRSLDEAGEAYQMAKFKYDTAKETLNFYETQNENNYNKSINDKVEIGKLTKKREDLISRKLKLQNIRAVAENDIIHIREQITNTEIDIKIKENAKTAAISRRDEEKILYEQKNIKLYSYDQKREENELEYEKLSVIRNDIESEILQYKTKLKEFNEIQNEAKLNLATIDGAASDSDGRFYTLNNEIQKNEDELINLSKKTEKIKNTVSDYINKQQEYKKLHSEIYSKKLKLNEIENENKEAIKKIELDISSAKNKIDILTRMEEHFEGYASAVRSVMLASSENKLRGIIGPVSKLIEVKDNYILAIETSLGANLQNIVAEDENSIKEAINYLKINSAGRATFYPLSSIKPQYNPINSSLFESYRGYIGIASELVKYDEKYTDIINYLLSRTVVFDNLENASQMAVASGYKYRIVTLDGQLINAGGSYTGGSAKQDSGMLSRGALILKQREDISVLLDNKNEYENKLKNLCNDIISCDAEYAGYTEKLSIFETLLNAEKSQLAIFLNQFDIIKNIKEEKIKELNLLKIKISDSESEKIKNTNIINEIKDKIQDYNARLNSSEKEHNIINIQIAKKTDFINDIKLKTASIRSEIEASGKALVFDEDTIASIEEQLLRGKSFIGTSYDKIQSSQLCIDETVSESILNQKETDLIDKEIQSLTADITIRDENMNRLHVQIKEQNFIIEKLYREYNRHENSHDNITSEWNKLNSLLWDEYELTYSAAKQLDYPEITAETRGAAVTAQIDLKNRLRSIGTVNTGSIEEYKDVNERYKFLSVQLDDINKSKDNLSKIIIQLEEEMKKRFTETLSEINESFNNVFNELFGGGHASLTLCDPHNVLQSGIEINVAPPGKIIKTLSLLSGGEQAFVAIALFFAIIKINPPPFCILDEIEAALDEVNVTRFADYTRRYITKTQFIIITHRRGTMEKADMLYGITMPQRGISKVLPLNISEAEERLGIKL